MNANMRSRCEFDEHSEPGQLNRVVTRGGHLLAVREGPGMPVSERVRVNGFEGRHHQEMPAVRCAGAIQSGVAEPEYLIVTVVVT